MPAYVPDEGDIVGRQVDPQAGHEQAGHPPAIVLSPASYNARTGIMLCCPTTIRIKGYPFEVALRTTPPSVVLADRATAAELGEVRAKFHALIG